MFLKIRGKISLKEPFRTGLDVNFSESSITYEIFTPLKIYENYQENQVIELFIYPHLKEDEFSLYGFEKKEERDLFEKIISVPGIGPRVALQILSDYNVEEFFNIIEKDDIKSLSRIKGVGKKRASRIILELKEKIPSVSPLLTSIEKEAVRVLLNLGLRRKEAEEAVSKATKEKKFENLEELLKEVFRKQ